MIKGIRERREQKNGRSSHLGAGLVAGTVLGLAAGLFLQSRKGKMLTKDAQKKAMQLQAKVMKKLGNVQEMTREKYEDVVEDVLDYYLRSKELAAKELPQVRAYLLGRWKTIQKHLDRMGEDEE